MVVVEDTLHGDISDEEDYDPNPKVVVEVGMMTLVIEVEIEEGFW